MPLQIITASGDEYHFVAVSKYSGDQFHCVGSETEISLRVQLMSQPHLFDLEYTVIYRVSDLQCIDTYYRRYRAKGSFMLPSRDQLEQILMRWMLELR